MKIGLVSTLKDSVSDTEMFISYHLKIGFDLVIIFDDEINSPIVTRINNPSVLCVKRDDLLLEKWKKQPTYNFLSRFVDTEVMARQILNTNVAIKIAKEQKLDWLLHIDGDELFYSPLLDIKLHFDQLTHNGVQLAIYDNHEAILPRADIDNAFLEVKLFKKNLNVLNWWQRKVIDEYSSETNPYFNFYSNGKAAVKISSNPVCVSPHRFVIRYPICNIIKRSNTKIFSHPCVLHFACCGFNAFLQKYIALGNFDNTWFGRDDITLHVHKLSRDVVLANDIASTKAFYQQVFVKNTFDINFLLSQGICFNVGEFFDNLVPSGVNSK